jgi:hypothetical protein
MFFGYHCDDYFPQNISCRRPTFRCFFYNKYRTKTFQTHRNVIFIYGQITNSVAQEPEGSSPHSPPSVPVLSQSNPVHTPQGNLPKIHSDPIFQPTPWSSKWYFSVGLPHQNLVHFSLFSYACHMPRPPHTPQIFAINMYFFKIINVIFVVFCLTDVNFACLEAAIKILLIKLRVSVLI